jgi:pimeloyl-ACP methyl ester carboxylesterase
MPHPCACDAVRSMPESSAARSRTLVLWGDRDALFPRTDQDRVAAAIPGGRLVVYERRRATARNRERPEQVAADIGSFVPRG